MSHVLAGGPDPTKPKARPERAPGRVPGQLLTWLESLGLFALGFAVMHTLYAATVFESGTNIGVPGHDSFYHIAMASMLPQYGAMPEFPWLVFTYFRDNGSEFVSHHWGFHLMLLPFVKAAEYVTGDALTGGRWAVSAFFGGNLVLFHHLLRLRRVPAHWLWIALFFLLPDQFYSRHGFVRAIGPSLLFMQLILLALFARRIWLAGLAVAGYVHLYLGAVMFGPLLVAIHAASQAFGPRGDRRIPWKMMIVTAAAWALGVATYPYAGGIFEFLKLQVFGSGLSPDIEVGREWKPYSDAWFLVTMAAPLLATWVAALMLRLRMGPALSAHDTALMVLQFLFLVLTFKARRFIEYWPPICLLSAAYMATPPLTALVTSVRAWTTRRSHVVARSALGLGLLTLTAAALIAWSRVDPGGDAELLLTRWQIWTPALGFLTITALLRVGRAPSFRPGRIAAVVLLAALLPAATLAVGAGGLASASRQLRCYYDLDAIEDMMAFIEADSETGEVIFTDDWDIFPPFFYHNRHNRYIVGLDPKFTHQREPDLWNRYVKISRGQVPSTIQLATATGEERATVALEDIREYFGARYVIADRDHRQLADALANRPEFAELVYPQSDYRDAREQAYVVFRIRQPGEARDLASGPADPLSGPVFLSELRPISVSQGWGDLGTNRSVDGNTIRLDGRAYAHGIGTHAPSRLLYDLPAGFAWFETLVGIDDETKGEGSVTVTIALDGRIVYESPELRGGTPPAVARIPLEGARQLQLEAHPTADGQRFDHVCWADARLIPVSDSTSARSGALPPADGTLHAASSR